MFDKIVESALNEISADDAYIKFYNKMPKKVFDYFVALYGGKFDALIKFVLKFLMENEGEENEDYAIEFLEEYKKTENNVRMEFLKRFKNGAYEDVIDAFQGLKDIKDEGVSTVSSRQKQGYVVLYDDSDYLLTCTLTYEANQHYYGKSSWCTASDRMGRYDGWYYFLYYTLLMECDEIKESYLNGEIGDAKVYTVLMQYLNKTTNSLYQIQVYNSHANSPIGQICDANDDSASLLELDMSETAKKIMLEKVDELSNLQEQALKKEAAYQLAKEPSLERKRKIRKQKCFDKLKVYFDKKVDIVNKANEHIFNSNLLSTPEFIETLLENYESFLDRDFYMYNIYERRLQKQGYLNVTVGIGFDNGMCALLIEPCYGVMKVIDSGFNEKDKFFYDLDYEAFDCYNDDDISMFDVFKESNMSPKFKSALVFIEASDIDATYDGLKIKKVNKVLNVLKFDTANTHIGGLYNNGKANSAKIYTMYSCFEAIPDICFYRVNSLHYIYSFSKRKSMDLSKYYNGPEEKEQVLSSLRGFWCGGPIVILFACGFENIGVLIDEDFNVVRTYSWCFIEKNNKSTNLYLLADSKTKELFIVGRSGLLETRQHMKGSNSDIVTFDYNGIRMYAKQFGNGIKGWCY